MHMTATWTASTILVLSAIAITHSFPFAGISCMI